MRKINLTQEDLKPMKAGVSPSQVDELMRKVSKQLNETWLCAKDGATWYFVQNDEDGKRVKTEVSRRRNFVQALSDATDAHVVTLISL